MKPNLIFTFSFVLICLSRISFAGVYLPTDSIGIERKGNKTFILHRVETGQTLYSLARQYRTTLTDIKAENSDVEAGLQPGQVIKIPYVAPQAGSVTSTSTPRPATQAQTTGVHTVAVGESLFGIAKMYQVSVADLRKWNGLSGNSIKVGDELAVTARAAQAKAGAKPAGAPVSPGNASPHSDAGSASGRKTHTVASGQTLNAVSRLYKVSLSDLRQWNNLASDNLSVGQELVIQGSTTAATYSSTEEVVAEEIPSPKAAKEKEPEPEKAPAPKEKAEETAPKKAPKEEAKPASEANNTPAKTVPPAGGYQKALQVGLAELIDGTQGNEKYLALHRTAPVGTIIQVKNLMNDLSVFVKVIGKLPDTGANDKLVVKISNKAYERLAAVDKKFRVEVSYIP
jgi:LysM repeat protein